MDPRPPFPATRPEEAFDLLVVGGGINGTGIARDAAGRGLKVMLCEQGDLAEGTSSRSGKLIHGGLRYLEYREFRLVREALIEREVLLQAAPHIIWPMRFVLPHTPEQRPQWLIRLGLFLYDNLGGRRRLPGTRVLDLARDPEGAALKPGFRKAFEYSDCWVDDARLVVLNALDARNRGAVILPRTRCAEAQRENGLWRVVIEDRRTGLRQTVPARAVVNAAGPWVQEVLAGIPAARSTRRVRLVKGSHLVVPKFWRGENSYLLQNDDRRVIFVNPYEDRFALIGTTDIPQEGRPEEACVDAAEIDYLLSVLNRYFKWQLAPDDIVHRFSGVRPLYDDQADNPSAVTRDYAFDIDPAWPDPAQPPVLSVYGGKITTYRKLAEHALDRLSPYLPSMGSAWTSGASLPGGDMPGADFDAFLADVHARLPWLPLRLARHYARLYGTRMGEVLGDAGCLDDLGQHFGGCFYEREAVHLLEREWALDADDILERRTKHGLHLTEDEKSRFRAWLAGRSVRPHVRPLDVSGAGAE